LAGEWRDLRGRIRRREQHENAARERSEAADPASRDRAECAVHGDLFASCRGESKAGGIGCGSGDFRASGAMEPWSFAC
jgi:hypothetical protein